MNFQHQHINGVSFEMDQVLDEILHSYDGIEQMIVESIQKEKKLGLIGKGRATTAALAIQNLME